MADPWDVPGSPPPDRPGLRYFRMYGRIPGQSRHAKSKGWIAIGRYESVSGPLATSCTTSPGQVDRPPRVGRVDGRGLVTVPVADTTDTEFLWREMCRPRN